MKTYLWYICIGSIGAILITIAVWQEPATTIPHTNQANVANALAVLSEMDLPFERLHDSLVVGPNGNYIALDGFTADDAAFDPFYAIYDIRKQEYVSSGAGDIISDSRSPHLLVSSTDATYRINPHTYERHKVVEAFSYDAVVSPDGTYIALRTEDGPYIYNATEENILYGSSEKHVIADWISDELGWFGFYSTGESLGDGATAYVPAVFSNQSQIWQKRRSNSDVQTFKRAEVIDSERVWITAGFDDGSFEYLLSLPGDEMTFMQETSEPGHVLTYQPYTDEFIGFTRNSVTYYDQQGQQTQTRDITPNMFRRGLVPLPDGALVYGVNSGTSEQGSTLTAFSAASGEYHLYTFDETIQEIIYDEAYNLLLGTTPTQLHIFLLQNDGGAWYTNRIGEI